MGDRFTIADAAVASMFVSMEQADAAPDRERYRNLAAYLDVQFKRPSIASLIEQESQATAVTV